MAAKASGTRKETIPIIPFDAIKPLGPIAFIRSDVHEATWTKPETKEEVKVAVKMTKELSEESLKIMCPVSHENLLEFHGAVLPQKIGGEIGIVTEFCSGGSLYDVLNDKERKPNIEFSEKQDWALGIAEGMYYLHRKSRQPFGRYIRHNNLSSVTVYMKVEREKLVPKIGGFGYAKVYSANDSIRGPTTLTTEDYAWHSPQRIKGDSCCPKSDVYSFAIILWELYTRKDPYEVFRKHYKNTFLLTNAIVDGKRPLESEFAEKKEGKNDDWVKLIRTCWAQEPKERPTFKDIVLKLYAIEDATRMQRPPEDNSTDSDPSLVIQESDIVEESEYPRNGRFGRVILATHKGVPIALRSVSTQCTDDVRFDRYLDAMIQLAKLRKGDDVSEKCPNLVYVIGACHRPTFPFKIAMERMETSLRDKLERCVISNDDVYKKIALDVACGLHYLHSFPGAAFYHGTLTSGNVLLKVEECDKSTKTMTGKDIKTQHFVVDKPFVVDRPVNHSSHYLVVAKISDFCRDILNEKGGSSPSIEAYEAPEADREQIPTEKQDVFAYGVLLLDMRLTESSTRKSVGASSLLDRKKALNSFQHAIGKDINLFNLVQECTKEKPTARPENLMQRAVDTF